MGGASILATTSLPHLSLNSYNGVRHPIIWRSPNMTLGVNGLGGPITKRRENHYRVHGCPQF